LGFQGRRKIISQRRFLADHYHNDGVAFFDNLYSGNYTIILDKQSNNKMQINIQLHSGINNIGVQFNALSDYFSFDDGPLTWIRNGNWGLSDTEYYSPGKSLSDSPNANYPSGSTSYCKYPGVINLTDCSKATLTFMTKYDFSLDEDHVSLQISDDGSNWKALDVFRENQSDWTEKYYFLDEYIGQNVYLRFFFNSDGDQNSNGIFIDDFKIYKYEPSTPVDNTVSEKPVLTALEIIQTPSTLKLILAS
jgi:hypothetical protein